MADLKISALPASTVPLAGTEVLPIVQSGATKQVSVANLTAGRTQTSNGIVQGTAATGYNFSSNTPSAGMTSQLLNWYEEGAWTPIDSSGASLTLTGASGQYVRNGKIVQCAFAFTFPATASTLNVSIGGLPFTCTSTDTGWGGYQTYTDYSTAQLSFLNNVSATTFTMWRNGGTIVTNITLSGNTVRGVITYRAA